MAITIALNGALGLLPVLVFLAALLQSDSFKLVRFRFVLALIGAGAGAAVVSYFVGRALLQSLNIGYEDFTHFGGPLLEEALKAAILIGLIRMNRIGFTLDAAISGFAVGAGFAVAENYFYLQVLGTGAPALWVVRGFGTAIMHGGAAALFALMGHLLAQRGATAALRFVPGFVAASALHIAFNQFTEFPVSSTIAMFSGLAAAMALVLHRGSKSVDQWLKIDYEAQRRLLDQIRSGKFADDSIGRKVEILRSRLHPYQVSDILRYMELHTELVIEAQEVLSARDRGADIELGKPLREKLARYRVIEEEVGQAVRIALGGHLHFSRQDFFQLYTLKRDSRRV